MNQPFVLITGIDITPAYIDYANEQAKKENLNVKFICQDIRTITFDKEYDVVLNMADGAIGYLEDDEENHKIFSVIAKAINWDFVFVTALLILVESRVLIMIFN